LTDSELLLRVGQRLKQKRRSVSAVFALRPIAAALILFNRRDVAV